MKVRVAFVGYRDYRTRVILGKIVHELTENQYAVKDFTENVNAVKDFINI